MTSKEFLTNMKTSLLFLVFTLNLNVFCRTVRNTNDAGGEYPWDISKLGKNLQSPVDIITKMAVKKDYPPLRFTAVNDKSMVCDIQNSGHGVVITLDNQNDSMKPRLDGSFLTDTYVFENLHFHWGREDYFGSEHFIDGESFSMEGHMVMYKKAYGNIERALEFKDGVMVLTFFAKASNEDNKYFNRMLKYVNQVEDGSWYSVTGATADPILWFLPDTVAANRYGEYYAYPGSLTTAPFSESVTFIILPKPIHVSHNQLAILRRMKNDEMQPVLTNRRELQPLVGRPLIKSNNIQWNIKAINNNNNNNNINNNIVNSQLNLVNDPHENAFIWSH